MIVWGTLKGTNVGGEFYQGDLEDCQAYVNDHLDKNDFSDLDICQDNGEIIERIVTSK